MGPNSILANEPLLSGNIGALEIVEKVGSGFMLQNRSSAKLHYEVAASQIADFENDALSRRIPIRRFPADGTLHHNNNGVNRVAVSNGPGSRPLPIPLEEACDDILVTDDCCIPLKDKRRNNRGPSVGVAGNQGNV
jgi:hypothetical protein